MQEAITAAVASSSAEITDVMIGNLPEVFKIFGSLIALTVIIRLIYKLVGRRS